MRQLFAAGLLFGIGFEFKQFAMFYLIGAVVAEAYALVVQTIRPRDAALRLLALFVGFMIPFLFVLAYYAFNGLLGEAVYFSLVEPVFVYKGDDTPIDYVHMIRIVPVALLALLGILWGPSGNGISAYKKLLLALSVALSCLALTKYVVGHYFIPAVPAAVVLSASLSSQAKARWKDIPGCLKIAFLSVIVLSFAAVAVALAMRASLIKTILSAQEKVRIVRLAADIAAYAEAGDMIYLDASSPTHGCKIYAVCRTVPAGKIWTFRYPDRMYFSRDHGRSLLANLRSSKVKVVLWDWKSNREGWSRQFYGDVLDEIETIIREEYVPMPNACELWRIRPMVRKELTGKEKRVITYAPLCIVVQGE